MQRTVHLAAQLYERKEERSSAARRRKRQLIRAGEGRIDGADEELLLDSWTDELLALLPPPPVFGSESPDAISADIPDADFLASVQVAFGIFLRHFTTESNQFSNSFVSY